jgi:hypothetical protein
MPMRRVRDMILSSGQHARVRVDERRRARRGISFSFGRARARALMPAPGNNFTPRRCLLRASNPIQARARSLPIRARRDAAEIDLVSRAMEPDDDARARARSRAGDGPQVQRPSGVQFVLPEPRRWLDTRARMMAPDENTAKGGRVWPSGPGCRGINWAAGSHGRRKKIA